jgi:hypothetical protein
MRRLCLGLFLLGAAPALFAQSLFTLDVFPGDDAPRTPPVAQYGELVNHLDATLNARFLLRVMPSRQVLEDALRNPASKTHFVLTDGVLPLPGSEYTVLHESREKLTAVLLVWDNSSVQSLADLRDKAVLANPHHTVAKLAQRMMKRNGVEFAVGGGRHHNEHQLADHFARFGGRDALLTSAATAERLMAEHPGRFRSLPETESAPRWVLAGHKSLPETVHVGIIDALEDVPEAPGAGPSKRLLPVSWTLHKKGAVRPGTISAR